MEVDAPVLSGIAGAGSTGFVRPIPDKLSQLSATILPLLPENKRRSRIVSQHGWMHMRGLTKRGRQKQHRLKSRRQI